MASLPGGLTPWVELRFLKRDADGVLVPNAGGFVEWRETDLTTPKATYSTSDVNPATGVPNTNPIELDADGRPPDPIYLAPGGYSVFVTDDNSVALYDVPFVQDVGATAFSNLGNILSEGSKSVSGAGPYVVTVNDNLVTVDTASSPFVVQLPAASDRTGENGNGLPLTIKNFSSAATVRVTPDGSDLIDDNVAGTTYIVLAANGGSVTLVSDGSSDWYSTS